MACLESFEFGSNTFDNLESQVQHVIDGDKSSIENQEKNALEIILESPTNEIKKNNTARTRSRFLQSFRTESQRHRWRRSNSDSKLLANKDSPITTKSEHYSKFFESDFALSFQEKGNECANEFKENIVESLLNVSKIEAVFNSNESKDEISFNSDSLPIDLDNSNEAIESEADDALISALEVPICSEDINGLLQTEEYCNQSQIQDDLLQNIDKMEEKNLHTEQQEENVMLDESSFICPIKSNDDKNLIEKALKDGRKCIKENQDLITSICRFESSRKLNNSIKSSTQHTTMKNQPSNMTTRTKDLESLKHISAWNLPQSVLAEYEKKGIMKMFDWQIECLSNPKILFENCNLVYSAPTSAGKTLVSEILLLKTVLERNKKVLMILPFISVVREKMLYLQDLLTPAGYRVEGFFGGYSPPGGFDSINVAICTIEKANSIVNKLLEQNKLETIGTVVVDEIHLISDPGRGYILELLLAKILFMSRKYGYRIQIVTMSATLANVELLKRWLDAELFITNYRPVALREMIKIGTKIYDTEMKFIRDVKTSMAGQIEVFKAIPNDADNVALLCIETILEGCSVIVFCPSKDWCEKLAVQLASVIHGLMKGETDLSLQLRRQLKREAINEMKAQLREIPTGLDAVLEKTTSFGCAFHHAGLTTEERDIVETCFKTGALKIIVATSTLSSGVNLPARRVIIRTPLFAGKQMNSLTYKQMIGRAGRTGKDTLGESILVCTEANTRIGKDLVTAELKPIMSCLELDGSTHLKRALLEVISSGVATTKDDITQFVNCTLLSAQIQCSLQEKEGLSKDEEFISDALNFLIEFEFIRLQFNEETGEDNYIATRLGLACLASSMPPTDGLILFSELQNSRRCFVLESELHAVYLVTPYSVCYQMQELDWLFFLDLWERLSPAMRKVGELVGVKESFLVRAMRGQSKLDYKLMQIHKRFYTALALQELVNETPINTVARKYKCTRGLLQSLQQMASTFAGIVTAFCNALQWDMLHLIVSQFKERLFFGVHRDLVDLMRLPDLSQKRARVLFNAGITSLVELANADALTIEKLLFNSLSFDSAKQREHENSFEAEQRNIVRNFFITGKAGLTVSEAAKLLIKQSRQFVEYEMGIGKIKWMQASSQEEVLVLHMSCEGEEQMCKRVFKKRKSNEDIYESPLKLNKIGAQEVILNNCNKMNELRKLEPTLIQTDKKDVFIKPDSYEKKAEISIKTNFSVKLPEKLPNSIKDNTKNGENINKKKLSLVKTKKTEKELTNATTGCQQEKLEAVRELASKPKQNQFINIHAKEVGNEKLYSTKASEKITTNTSPEVKNQRIDKRDLTYTTESTSSTQPTDVKKYTQSKSKAAENLLRPQIAAKEKLNPTPTQKLRAQPRRSPRNHLSSSINNQTKSANQMLDIQDIFASDDSFEINAGLKPVEKLATNQPGAANSPQTEEIPSSQHFEENICNATTTTPKHTSRLLRSYRAQQRTASPNSLNNVESAIPPVPVIKNNSDISDVSIQNTSSPFVMQMNASHILSCVKEDTISSNFNSVEIVDICGDLEVFKAAFDELLTTKRFGFSLGLQQQLNKRKPLIGANLLINQLALQENKQQADILFSVDDNSYLACIAFSIAENVVYYMNMQEVTGLKHKQVCSELKLKYLKNLFSNGECTLIIYEARKQLKLLRKAIPGIEEIAVKVEDPKIANWLLQPDKKLSLKQLAQQYAPECSALVDLCGGGRGYNSHGVDVNSAIIPKIRSSIEACVVVHILQGQNENLERIGSGELQKFFQDLEMPLQLSLCNMETTGFPANELALRELFQKMLDTSKKLETKIFALHGKRFNLSSAAAVGRVLGLHRKANGRISTSRQVLEKIDEPIAQLIIAYRKLNVTMTKNIQPLLQCAERDRIHGQSDSFTSTGRISMKDPNLQNVAKDFKIELGGEKVIISCRSAFFPKDESRVLISADFCQLEMRILAHLAKDPHLIKIMSSDQDIFIAIAAGWNHMKESEVSEHLRNGTKQICYGIIYGMGIRALAEALKCSEDEARLVSEQFHQTYPAIRNFTNKVLTFARENGYVETIQGRRRYLEHINSDEPALKNQAERQAVNSTIQGSAADIAKKAILRTEKSILKYRSKLGLELHDAQFVLHVHDELIFEVPAAKAKKIAKVISLTMAACTRLDVPLRVKLKMGRSWGELKEINF